MASDALASGAPRRTAPFAPNHRWDRNFFLLYVALIWLGVVMGFGGDIQRHIAAGERPYPLIVHFHAVAFVGWLVVLTTQVLFIRRGRHDLHKALGVSAIALAAIMVVLGPATAIVVQRQMLGTHDSDPAFFAIQFTDILAFAGFAAAAFAFRGQSSAHKRLMIMAAIYISDAGFGRWLGPVLHGAFGAGALAQLLADYFPNILLFLGIGVYDLITRGRLLPAYLAGLVWAFANMATAEILYPAPWWKPVAMKLL